MPVAPTRPAALLRGFLFLVLAAACDIAHADEALWAQLRAGGLVVFIRHADTDPGVGDPPGFRLDDCKSQRNLSAAGREQARRLGEVFRRERVPVAQVLSSEWCRCRDTATLAFERYEPWAALNNLFGRAPGTSTRRQTCPSLAENTRAMPTSRRSTSRAPARTVAREISCWSLTARRSSRSPG